MKAIIKETARKGNRVVITNNKNTTGIFESRTYIDNNGELTAGFQTAEHKTLKGAEKWAKRTLGI